MTHVHRLMRALAARMDNNHVRAYVCVVVRACVYACKCVCAWGPNANAPMKLLLFKFWWLAFTDWCKLWPQGWGGIMYAYACALVCAHACTHACVRAREHDAHAPLRLLLLKCWWLIVTDWCRPWPQGWRNIMYIYSCALVCVHACTHACVRAWKPNAHAPLRLLLLNCWRRILHRLMQALAARMEKHHVRVYVCAGVRACVYACMCACLEAQCPCAFETIISQMLMTSFTDWCEPWPQGWGRIMYVYTCMFLLYCVSVFVVAVFSWVFASTCPSFGIFFCFFYVSVFCVFVFSWLCYDMCIAYACVYVPFIILST